MANRELDVTRLRVLREVGLHGSLAGAARVLGLTASAVSQQVAALEREAGTALVDRSPRGVVLTGAGQALAGRAGELLDVLAAARSDLDRLSGVLGGRVGVASVASAAATVVSGAVCRLRETHPDVAVEVVSAEPDRALGRVLGGESDIAVVDEYELDGRRVVPVALPDAAVVRELAVEPLVVVRAQRAPAVPARRSLAITDLAGADWVLPPDDAACGRAVRAACRAAGFDPRPRWQSDDMLLLVRAVADGHGVTVLPRRAVPDDLAGIAGVDVRPLREPLLRRRLLAVARASVAERGAVAAVLDALRVAAG